MRSDIVNRAIKHAQHYINHDTTVRETAKEFGVSKSTVHMDLIKRLPQIHTALHAKVMEKLSKNKAERHMRGGLATKELWESGKIAEQKKEAENAQP